MKCNKCLNKNSDSSIFCGNCWRKLKEDFLEKYILWYFSFWLNENIKDFISRKEAIKIDNLNKDFIINILLIFSAIILFFIFPLFWKIFLLYFFIIILLVFIIDIFLWRLTYIMDTFNLWNKISSELLSKISWELFEENWNKISKISDDYLIKSFNNLSLKYKCLYIIKNILIFHWNLAVKIVYSFLNFNLKYIIPNTDFNNYLLKILFYLYLPFKIFFWILISLFTYVIKWIIKKILILLLITLILVVAW